MSKLSQQSLEKRFLCSHCQQTFRTRQGLSGHIQFKHPSKTMVEDAPNYELLRQNKEIHIGLIKSVGYSHEEASELAQIPTEWYYIKALIEDKNTKLNSADFKTYLIVAYAQMLANRRLIGRLNKDLAEAISKLMGLQSEINASMYKKSS